MATGLDEIKGMSRRELSRLIERYGWFTTARRIRAAATGEADGALTLSLGFWPILRPDMRPNPPTPDHAAADSSAQDRDQTRAEAPNVIDRFLELGEYRIVPSDEAPGVNVDVEIDPEMVTEQLAEIYRAQGLDDKADEIFRILGLRNS